MPQTDTLVLIPARMAATRLPGKPLLDIAGLPMIVHVLRRAEAADIGRVAHGDELGTIALDLFREHVEVPPRREADHAQLVGKRVDDRERRTPHRTRRTKNRNVLHVPPESRELRAKSCYFMPT